MTTPALRADLDPDGVGAGSLAAAAAELIGPLASAAAPQPLEWASTAARVEIPVVTRHPLVLVTLLTDRGAADAPDGGALEVTVTVDGAAGPEPLILFAPHTPAGSAVAAVAPATDDDGASPPFALRVQVRRRAADGSVAALTRTQIRAAVRLDLVQGQLGRVLATMLAEKVRLRRQARELAAMRAVAVAERDALDRIGAELRCPRFVDELVWDPAHATPGTQPLPAGTAEPDTAYRARLALLRSARLPSPRWIDAALNGSAGAGAAPTPGLLAGVGLTTRVEVDETPNPFLVAFRLVSPRNRHGRAHLLDAVRTSHLLWPSGSAAGDRAHATRMLTPGATARLDAARAALATWQLPAAQPVAPALALALQRLGDLGDRLGGRPWPQVLAGQADDGGSRRELGLGAILAAPDGARLDAAVSAAAGAGLVAAARTDDPAGAWLLRAAGLRTAELLPDGTVFVSALATGPLVVDVAPSPDQGTPITVTASLPAETDAAQDAPLAAVVAVLTADGLSTANPATLLGGVVATATNADLARVVGVLGLPAVTDVGDVRTRLLALPTRTWAVVDLGAARTADVVTDPSRLSALLAVAARAGASSALPLVTGTGTLAVALGVTGLPLAGSNLAGRHTVAYRWQVRGLSGTAGVLSPRRGATVTLTSAGDGIDLVACVAYVRTGGNDPYEWRPQLPTGALLTLPEYEYLMNAVELVTPLGVRADTWEVRRRHVDVDGSGAPTPLPPAAARTYRRFRPR